MVDVFGTICLDRVLKVPRLPEAGDYVEAELVAELLGGEAANTFVALLAWGVEARLIGNPLGCDADGRTVSAAIESLGLEPRQVAWGMRTPVCTVMVAPNGERSMAGVGFAALESAAIDYVPSDSGWFTTEPNLGKLAIEAAKSASEAGLGIYLMDFDAPEVALKSTDWMQISADRCGRRVSELESEASRIARENGCNVVVTAGAGGGAWSNASGSAHSFEAFAAEPVVDTTAAGDMFRAGMLYGLVQNWPIERATKFAAAAGALCCSSLGGTSPPPLADVMEVGGL